MSVLACSACNRHVFSPPAQGLALETAKGRRLGETAVQAEVAGFGAVFGPSLTTGRFGVEHGLADDLQGSIDASLLHVHVDDPAVDTDTNVYAGRIGVKHTFVQHVGALGGLGGGASAAGTFFSPDVGLIIAYENPYFIPFMSPRGFVSVPLAAKRVDVSDADDGPGTEFGKPLTTYGYGVSLGFRVPLTPDHDPPGDRAVASLLAGLGLYGAFDSQESEGFAAGGIAAEVPF